MHKYYSNLILNRFVIMNVEVSKYKDVFNTYFMPPTRKFNFFTIQITLTAFEDTDILSQKIKVTNYVTYNIKSEHYSTFTTEIASDFLHRVVSIYYRHKYSLKVFPKIEIVFISDLKDITQKHYLEQPNSMLCHKLIRRFYVSPQDFEYKWLPHSFKHL